MSKNKFAAFKLRIMSSVVVISLLSAFISYMILKEPENNNFSLVKGLIFILFWKTLNRFFLIAYVTFFKRVIKDKEKRTFFVDTVTTDGYDIS